MQWIFVWALTNGGAGAAARRQPQAGEPWPPAPARLPSANQHLEGGLPTAPRPTLPCSRATALVARPLRRQEPAPRIAAATLVVCAAPSELVTRWNACRARIVSGFSAWTVGAAVRGAMGEL